MLVTFVVQRFTSVEELQNLAGVLENGGQFGLLSVLKGRSDGQLRMGAINMPIALVVVEEQGRDYRYLFLTPRRIQVEEEMLGEESLNYPFGIAEFEVDRFGRGEGRIHVAAALSIDADGYVEIEDYDGVDGTIDRIKQTEIALGIWRRKAQPTYSISPGEEPCHIQRTQTANSRDAMCSSSAPPPRRVLWRKG